MLKSLLVLFVLLYVVNSQLLRQDRFNFGSYNKETKKYENQNSNKPESKIFGQGNHDFVEHGNHGHKLIGSGNHDFVEHGNNGHKKLFGSGNHDFVEHGHKKLIGRGNHDFVEHGNSGHEKLIGGGNHDFVEHGSNGHNKLIDGGKHDFVEDCNHGDNEEFGNGKHGFVDLLNRGHKVSTSELVGNFIKHHCKKMVSTSELVGNFIKHHCKKMNQFNELKTDSKIQEFAQFAVAHDRVYKNCEELQRRLGIFNHNLEVIALHQTLEQGTAKYGVNKFADWTRDEFRKLKGLRTDLRPAKSSLLAAPEISNFTAPNEFDWRRRGVVTPVKDQGMCGSCWAFSVTGNVEGQWALKNKKLYSLSEQELVDCDKTDQGCSGGFMENAYKAIEELGGLETEKDYPYEAENEQCHFEKNKTVVRVIGGQALPKDEVMLKEWLYKNGPISIGINANALQFYMGGVSHPLKFLCNPKNLDHGMLIVGYGVHTTKYLKRTLPYWIVKNSWGEDWGEKGYYRVYRGDGTCGVNTDATTAIVPRDQ